MQSGRRIPISYILVITGFAVSLALHLASFWAPGINDYGLGIGLAYSVLVIGRNLTALRRGAARLPRTPTGPGAAPGVTPRLGLPTGVPAGMQGIGLIQMALWGYSVIWLVQLCSAAGSDANPYLVRAWSALGLALFFRWALEIAQKLGWWGTGGGPGAGP